MYCIDRTHFKSMLRKINVSEINTLKNAVIWVKYRRYGVKHYPINQSEKKKDVYHKAIAKNVFTFSVSVEYKYPISFLKSKTLSLRLY